MGEAGRYVLLAGVILAVMGALLYVLLMDLQSQFFRQDISGWRVGAVYASIAGVVLVAVGLLARRS